MKSNLGKVQKVVRVVFLTDLAIVLLNPHVPWEFQNQDLAYQFIWYSTLLVPILVFFLAIIDFFKNTQSRMIVINVIGGMFVGLVFLAILMVYGIASERNRGVETIHLHHKFKEGRKVVFRYENSPEFQKAFLVKPITPWLQTAREIDTTTLIKHFWVAPHNYKQESNRINK